MGNTAGGIHQFSPEDAKLHGRKDPGSSTNEENRKEREQELIQMERSLGHANRMHMGVL